MRLLLYTLRIKALVFHNKTKHIEVKYHFIREKIAQGVIKIGKVSTKENLANIITMVSLCKFKYCLKLLGFD